jgi:hypothetical protein
MQTMPQPKPSLKEMMAQNISNNAVESMINTSYKTADQTIASLYRPIYERFQNVSRNPGLIKMTAAEQTMIANFRSATKGLTANSQFDFFRLQMLYRPVVGNGKPMWALAMPLAKTPSAERIYQQMKTLEGSFDWKDFQSSSEKYVMKFGGVPKNLDAVHKKFNADLQNLPKKKVTTGEGFSVELEDPQKAIALWRNYGVKTQQALEEEYQLNYSWWNEQYQKLKTIGISLDALSVQLSNAEGEASSLQDMLADLQIRTWEAIYKLSAVTQRLYNDRLIGLMNEQQVKQAIEMYRQYKIVN